MKAVLLHAYGGVDQLYYEEAPEPQPGAGEVLVRVISTSVNPVDYKIRSGIMKERMPQTFPAILGRDVASEVTGLGTGVSNFKIGDRVMGLVNRSYAEFLTAPADALTIIPEGLDEDAGAFPLVLLTGAQLIEKGVRPSRGEVVLVTGAAGSVGRTAVYVAKQHGATVIAGIRLKQKAAAESIGADFLVALDVDEELAALPELDAVADTVGGQTLDKLLAKLKKGGRLASVVGGLEATQRADIVVNQVWAQPDPNRLHQLAEECRDGKLRIAISRRVPLSSIREAQTAAENGSDGKILLLP